MVNGEIVIVYVNLVLFHLVSLEIRLLFVFAGDGNHVDFFHELFLTHEIPHGNTKFLFQVFNSRTLSVERRPDEGGRIQSGLPLCLIS